MMSVAERSTDWVRNALAPILLVLLATSPLASQETDICAFLPEGPSPIVNTTGGYAKAACSAFTPALHRASGQQTDYEMSLQLHASEEVARSLVGNLGQGYDRSRLVVFHGLGTYALEYRTPPARSYYPGADASGDDYMLWFNRGCYVFMAGIQTTTGVNVSREKVINYAARVDERLRDSAPCPGDAGVTDAPLADMLGVELSCQTNFSDPGLVVCDARPTNQRADAEITYTWTFDGVEQGVGTEQLTLTDVQASEHRVTVVAYDRRNNITSSPADVAFVKSANAGGDVPPPTVIGGFESTEEIEGDPADETSDIPVALLLGLGATGAVLLLGVSSSKRKKRKVTAAQPATETPASKLTPPAKPTPTSSSDPGPRTYDSRSIRSIPPDEVINARSRAAGGATATAAPPPAKPATQEKKTQDELWLEATPSTLTLRGDATRDGVAVKAYKSVNGVRADATAEVKVTIDVSDPHKIHLSQWAAASEIALTVHGTHIGNRPYQGEITLIGVSTLTGKATKPLKIPVRVDPVEAEIRFVIRKNGFLHQQSVTILPMACKEVRGTARAEDPSNPRNFEPVAFAHGTATLFLDGRKASGDGPIRTNEKGEFSCKLPSSLLQVYGVDAASYSLPQAVTLSVEKELASRISVYRDDAARLPKVDEYAYVRPKLITYPSEFFRQLCSHPEDDFPALVGALETLDAALVFTRRYHTEFEDQVRVIREQMQVMWNSVLDLFFDLISVSVTLVNWLKGSGATLKYYGRQAGSFIKFTEYTKEIPSGKSMLQDLFLWVQGNSFTRWALTTRPGRVVLNAIHAAIDLQVNIFERIAALMIPRALGETAGGEIFEKADRVLMDACDTAKSAGSQLKATWLREPWVPPRASGHAAAAANIEIAAQASRMTENLGAEATRAFTNVLLGLAKLLDLAGWAFKIAASCILAMIAFVFMVGVALMGVVISNAAKVVGLDRQGNTWAELVEWALGEYASKGFTNLLNWLKTQVTGDAPPEPTKNWIDEFTDLFMKPLPVARDMDERCAAELEAGYARCLELRVSENWRSARKRAIEREKEVIRRWQNQAEWVWIGEVVSLVLKLATKIFQGLAFATAAASKGIAKLLAAKAKQSELASKIAEKANSAANWVELRADVLEFIGPRLIITGFEIAKLHFIHSTAHVRVSTVFE